MTPKTRILLGVTGGIAAYKSPDLVRRLMERGADVQVVMTDAAQRFVSPMSFQAVSGRPTRSDLWDDAAEAAMGHIELARWAQVVLIAPASADFIARLAGGRADDLLATLCLATEAPIVIAPAMNRVMWANKATQANLEILVSRGIRILGPGSGNQACGEIGEGRMWEPVKLAESLLEPPPNAGLLAGLNVLITAGPTRERIDPVRYLTNRSSGKMGFAVAAAAREAGAHVTIVTGPVQMPTPAGITRINVESARDMYAAVHRQVADADVFIAAAAVADFQPVSVAKQKIKKQGIAVKLDLEPAPDIVKSVADMAQAPLRGRLRGRDQRRRRECAQQAQTQEARHDCRQPGRRRHRLRLRRQRAHRHLARRQGRGRARTENRRRAPAHRLDRQTLAAARRQSAARCAQAPHGGRPAARSSARAPRAPLGVLLAT